MLIVFVPCCGSLFSDWIPAFAGMTVVHKFSVMNYGKINKQSGQGGSAHPYKQYRLQHEEPAGGFPVLSKE
jgi:hypothetical protein